MKVALADVDERALASAVEALTSQARRPWRYEPT